MMFCRLGVINAYSTYLIQVTMGLSGCNPILSQGRAVPYYEVILFNIMNLILLIWHSGCFPEGLHGNHEEFKNV